MVQYYMQVVSVLATKDNSGKSQGISQRVDTWGNLWFVVCVVRSAWEHLAWR